jgi:hypothetical protein
MGGRISIVTTSEVTVVGQQKHSEKRASRRLGRTTGLPDTGLPIIYRWH